jgi:superfamily I DNA/RNA helicase
VCFALQLLSSLNSGEMAGLNSAMHFSGIDQVVLAEYSDLYDDDLEMFLYYLRDFHLVKFGRDLSSKILKFIRVAQLWESDLEKRRVNHVIQSIFGWFIDQLNLRNIIDGKNNFKQRIKSLTKANKRLSGMKRTLKQRLQLAMIGINSNHKSENKVPSVYLGTLHSAKGLEFNFTWIMQANHSVIPDDKFLSWEAVEEERRLFYVRITRPKIALFISCTGRPSKYIEEMKVQLKVILDVEGFEPSGYN